MSVARYLYPEAHIEKCDIRQYYPEQRFDVIIGNPPFNLKFDYKLSQEYYMDKAYDVLNPAGILMVIVPCSFMQSGFWEKTRIAGINGRFSFVGQTKLGPSAFAAVGVHDFNTKIMVFLRKSGHIKMQAYNAEEFITADELKKRIGEARAMKHRLRFDLMRETNRIDKEELELFEYKLAKYMYELKAHAKLNKHIDKAEALVTKFRNQKPPENATREQVEQWEKNKLTPKKVLAVIRRYITSQNTVPRKEVALVKTSYGFKLKQYAPRLLDKVPHKAASINDLVLERAELPMPEVPTEKNMHQIRAAEKLIRRKRREYEMQNRQFPEMEEDGRLKEYLDRCAFINKDGETCEFTTLQKHDLNLVLQKRHALLNWQQALARQPPCTIVPNTCSNSAKYGMSSYCSCHRHQYDMDTLPLDKQGTVPGGKEQCRPGSCAGRRVHRPIHLHARQAETGHGKVCQTQFKKTVPCFRRVGRDNQPVVTTYKAYPRSLPPPQIQDTRHRYDHTQQHRRTVQPV